MLLRNIQINGFGKLEDTNIDLKNGLNLIIGENESGKSTLMEFIKGIFYGVNKNKNGKDYSDFEKFKPWNEATFSGKMTYNIDNEEYVVYRDFNRNNTKVYDKMGIDITNDFDKDKARGAAVGVQHLGMDEDTFDNSVFVRQKEIKVNELSQNTMIQKLTNIIQSGDEDVSYQTTIKKLEKILMEEVGTDRTQNKPKNILKREIAELEVLKSQLLTNRAKHEEIENKLKGWLEKKKQNDKTLESAIKVFDIKNKYDKVMQEQKSQFEIEIKVKEEQKEKLKKETEKKKIVDTLLIAVATLILTLAFIFTNEIVLAILVLIIGIVSLIVNLKVSYKEEILAEPANFDIVAEEIRKKQSKELDALEKEGIKKTIIEKNINELKAIIESAEKEKNNYLLEQHKLEIEDKALTENLTNLTEIEEALIEKNEKLKEVLKKEETINFAISKLKESYTELKDEVIPDIEKDIKYTISKTTNGKYTKVKYNDYDGLVIENQLGQLINVDKLSVGTIDQMYLGFRMAIADKYNNIPIIFDEAFVFCDEERLENILKTLSEMAEERQIIILSCSLREENILENLNINFNKIYLK